MRAMTVLGSGVISIGIVALASGCGGHHSGGDGDRTDSSGTPPTPTIVACTDCPAFPPLGPDAPPACTGSAVDPQLVYPPDGVLLPPNMNVIAVHFMPGNANTIFELDFENATTDVRIETRCNAITNTRGSATGGCGFSLDPTEWSYVATQNRGGDPVTVTVRAAPADLSCVSGSNARKISYAAEDLAGGIYYWQSVTQGGVAGKTGGIFRKDFGNPDPTPEPFLTPGTQNKCVGCHFLSRDGLRMTFGNDDADSDDEYGDLKVTLYDVANRTALGATLNVPGFQTFTTDHAKFLASDGEGASNTAQLAIRNGNTGAAVAAPTFAALGSRRITHPDLGRDGTKVYFTVATPITGITGYNRKDDLHAMNGSIYAATIDTTANTYGTPSALVTAASADENNYYPAISPDGSSLVFNRAVGTTLDTHDSYNNPNAALYAMAVPAGTPVALARANLHDHLTNSWPRWSPFVQSYQGKHILWLTFSSTRDYGLRVQNENPPTGATFNCYPPVSPEDPSSDHAKPFDPNCTQPQIWMAAVTLEDLAAGVDPSFPAFWLPFQDENAHNHIAQWVDTITPPPTGCQQLGQSCTTAACCDGTVCETTTHTCESIIP
jgi:hypothetical protein